MPVLLLRYIGFDFEWVLLTLPEDIANATAVNGLGAGDNIPPHLIDWRDSLDWNLANYYNPAQLSPLPDGLLIMTTH